MRTILGVLLFLFGTTFWWMHSSMTGQASPPRHWTWTVTNVLTVLAIVACTMTAWAFWRHHVWWVTGALASGIVGLLAALVFVVAQRNLEVGLQDVGVQINIWMHLLGSAGLIAIALWPAARTWFTERP